MNGREASSKEFANITVSIEILQVKRMDHGNFKFLSKVFLDPARTEYPNRQSRFFLKYVDNALDELGHWTLIMTLVKSIKDDHRRFFPFLSGKVGGLNGHNGLK